MPTEDHVRWTGVCLDCFDADGLATFYSVLLGWDLVGTDEQNWRQLRPPGGGGVGINIQGEAWYQPPVWPERRDEQHKMMHFEIEVQDLEAAVSRVVALGGSEAVHQPADRDPSAIRIMLDPAGHPFCLFVTGE